MGQGNARYVYILGKELFENGPAEKVLESMADEKLDTDHQFTMNTGERNIWIKLEYSLLFRQRKYMTQILDISMKCLIPQQSRAHILTSLMQI